jgi:hypothetical protein
LIQKEFPFSNRISRLATATRRFSAAAALSGREEKNIAMCNGLREASENSKVVLNY